MVTVHPPLTTDGSVARRVGGSGQATPRHPPKPSYGCSLPGLTEFEG
jgi:hypothetical protein